MPSEAYRTFKINLDEVQRLKGVQITKAGNSDPRRGFLEPVSRKLNHINRSALIILCGSWDQYIKDVAYNSGNALTISRNASIESIKKSVNDILNLPAPVLKQVGINTRNMKSALVILESTGAERKNLYETRIDQAKKEFRSPRRRNIYDFFKNGIGVDCAMFLRPEPSKDIGRLDGIIDKRNVFAHHGVQHEEYFKRQILNKNIGVICRLAIKIDNHLKEQLTQMHPRKISPWKGEAD